MTARFRIATLLALPALVVAAPASAQQPATDTGGASFAAPLVAPGAVGGLLRGSVRWRGTLPGASVARVERLDEATATWRQVARVPVAPDGSFLATWPADRLGRATVRAVDPGRDGEAGTADAAPTTTVTVYRGVRATWYGPGFYGRRTACGERLTRTTIGVAHRRLPCGTKVEVFHNGRALVVPVIDRGPFANGAHYDLTAAAAQALGFRATGRIGVAPQAAGVVARRKKTRS
jgi:hypothetical protein